MTSKPTLQPIEPTTATSEKETTTSLDPFSPENLRLSQSFNEIVSVKKVLTTVPVRKPGQQDFVRVRFGPEWSENFPIVDLQDDREQFIVAAGLVPDLFTELVHKTLRLAINKQGTVFFWPIRFQPPKVKTWIGGVLLVKQLIAQRILGCVFAQI